MGSYGECVSRCAGAGEEDTVNWLLRLFSRDPDQETRIAAAHAQRADAAEQLAEAREIGRRNRRRVDANHFGAAWTAAFEANDRGRRA